MDPKTLNNLDPKLKETYDRVMGTTTPGTPAAPSATPAATTPPPVANPHPTGAMNVDITQAQTNAGAAPEMPQAAPTPSYNADNLRFQAAIQQTPVAGGTGAIPVGGAVANMPGQPSSLLRILYVIGAIVFFVVYTFVWIKLFNLPLPF